MRPDLLLGLTAIFNVVAAAGQDSTGDLDSAQDAQDSGVFVEIDLDLSIIPLDDKRVVRSSKDLFMESCPEEWPLGFGLEDVKEPKILASSWDVLYKDQFDSGQVFASSSSFIRGAVEAWAQHQYFSLRPDEVWFEVLVQLNFHMKQNAEKVRSIFVAHEGQEKLTVVLDDDKTMEVYENMLASFDSALQEKVRAKWLPDWIKPGFSTSTRQDNFTSTVLMMGVTQRYFEFGVESICGLPSVTLLGTKSDWVSLRNKLEHLKDFGEEAAEYARVLRPIFDGFVKTWDSPESEEIKDFWTKIVRGSSEKNTCDGGGNAIVSGWITGFNFWNEEGKAHNTQEQREALKDSTELDGVKYFSRYARTLPASYAKVNVKDNFGGPDYTLVAGNIGLYRTTPEEDTRPAAEPLSGWFLYQPVDGENSASMRSSNELSAIENLLLQCLKG